MSWVKRRGQANSAPPNAPQPQIQMYNPNQHSNQETNWQQDSSWYNQAQPKPYNYPPPQQPPLQQQQQHQYWQYPQHQQQQPQQTATNYQQNAQYPAANQQQQPAVQNQTYYQNAPDNQYNPGYTDAQNAVYTQQTEGGADQWNWGWGDEDNSNIQTTQSANYNQQQQQQQQQQHQQQAAITDSFANDESWNWTVEESNSASSLLNNSTAKVEPEAFPKMGKLADKHRVSGDDCELKPAEGRRGKSKEHLTPQWSTESQMSQESSDDVLHTSESEKMLSRSSTISHSPTSGADPPPEDAREALDSMLYYGRGQNSETMEAAQVQQLQLQQENVEVLRKHSANQSYKPNPSLNLPSSSKQNANVVKTNNSPPLSKPSLNPTPPPPPSKNATPPLGGDFQNPYKRASALPHHKPPLPHPKSEKNSYFYGGQFVNLESLPDNSEQPDNNEVAPMNERNQYLETGQLSDDNTNLQSDSNDTLPPPGLRRMVLGQIEQNDSALHNVSDEPPPGLSRMVLGQTEGSSSRLSGVDNAQEIGFQRMIPGESSPPEVSIQYQPLEPEQPQNLTRSATIGADTPPATNPIASPNLQSSMSQRVREPDLDGGNSSDPTQASARRQSVEGQTRELTDLVSSIRDLTVGENPSGHDSRRSSKESESDSEQEPRPRRSKEKEDGKYHRRGDRYPGDAGGYRDRDNKRPGQGRRYEDDTEEYYSDKERDRRRRDRRGDEHDRKYASLRREKEGRDKKRRDHREYYYNRYDDYEEQKSRPSSRSDSFHDASYRDRPHERDHRRHRERAHQKRSRDPFSSYMPSGYHYDPYNPYYQQYQQYQYYENLRRTNPQAYAEWYRKYFQQNQSGSFAGDDRGSVHSGRSSANDELNKDRYTRQSYYSQSGLSHHLSGYYRDSHSISGHYGLEDSSYSRPFDHTDSSLNCEDTTLTSQRLTPAKFATAHLKVSISSGRFVKVLPNYPLDGQSASVEVRNLQDCFADEEFVELSEFPGPLVRGVTHKKTVIEYCENKIRNVAYNDQIVDVDSYVLMWELLILLLRQNGMVVGTDIAELLMKGRSKIGALRPSSVCSANSDAAAEDNPSEASNFPMSEVSNSSNSALKSEIVTNKFRDFLIYGSVKEALEWAIKHGLWGHALFLASKLDKRTYANVMMRFANGLAMNDPLQTLYQLLSGKLPASATSVADDRWGDWRPHLAMILSNASQRPELERRSITTLGDTLFNRGSVFAAQFCYLMAQVGFNKYGQEDAKLVLLGSDQRRPFSHFATNEAMHMTEIYEYACKLNETQFVIPEFQPYKYLLATRLADRGLLEKSLSYLEQIAATIVQNPSSVPPAFVDQVHELADKLKYYDPVGEVDDSSALDGELDKSRIENSWLNDLKTVQNDFKMGLITHASSQNLASAESQEFDAYNQNQHQQAQQLYEQPIPAQDWQYQPIGEQQQSEYQQSSQLPEAQNNQFQESPQQPWSAQFAQPQQWADLGEQSQQISAPYLQENEQPQQQQLQTGYEYWNSAQSEDGPRPQISMPNQSKGRNQYESDQENEPKKEGSAKQQQSVAPSKKDKPPTAGWFGGIWNRLALRPKNQMKLPDDKNPTIVWDPEKKRWINLEAENNETSNELKPPPKMSAMFSANHADNSAISAPQQNHIPPMANQANPENGPQPQPQAQKPPGQPQQGNMFKLQRQRNLKKSYVDIFNPGGGKPPSGVGNQQAPSAFDSFAAPKMNYFIPQPVADPNAPIDFLTPATSLNQDATQGPQQ